MCQFMYLRTCSTSFIRHLLYWPVAQPKKPHRLSEWLPIFEPHPPQKSNALDWSSQPVYSPSSSFIGNLIQKNPWFIFDQRRLTAVCCPVQKPKTLPRSTVIWVIYLQRVWTWPVHCKTAIFISSKGWFQTVLKNNLVFRFPCRGHCSQPLAGGATVSPTFPLCWEWRWSHV